jgi:hypothetical protein
MRRRGWRARVRDDSRGTQRATYVPCEAACARIASAIPIVWLVLAFDDQMSFASSVRGRKRKRRVLKLGFPYETVLNASAGP